MGNYFYFPPKNKIVVARYVKFFKKNLISQEASGRAVKLKEIQDEDTSLFENTSEHLIEAESLKPQEDIAPIQMQSMQDNQVWHLVDIPPNAKTVRSKWLFKKKTGMDGNVHTFKARLVVNGYTQTYGIEYKETFSPVADIRAIRILVAIIVCYDYEIWQMYVKSVFLNGYLNEDIYVMRILF
nr:retrotransposon protein, putative, Ty1-copia subclass [Tanacetum cinerariifolium]